MQVKESSGPVAQEVAVKAVGGRPCKTVNFDEPLQRSGGDVASVQILRPRAADLKGVSLMDVMQMQTDAIAKVLPRITQPTLVAADVDALAPADLLKCAVEVIGFLLPKDAEQSLPA